MKATLDVSSTDQGTVNDNTSVSVDATQFFFVQKSNKLSDVDEKERPPMYVLSVKHDKSVGLTHSRAKTEIEPTISLVFPA